MTLKVVDVPDNAVLIEFKGIGVSGSLRFMSNVYVSGLPDAPTVAENATVEKPVIELPADLLETLTVEKENASGLLGFFDMDGHSAEIMNWLGEFLPEPDNLEPENIAADWYLDHVEFVPKKESKFYIRILDVFDTDGNELYLASMGNNQFRMTIYTDSAGMFTEDEADKIVADVSNSDVSLTARKVKVEE